MTENSGVPLQHRLWDLEKFQAPAYGLKLPL